MKRIWEWIVYSSADADKIGLTVKGFLAGLIPVVLFLTSAAKINVGQEQLTVLVDAAAVLVQALLGAVSAAMFLFGLGRKIWLTIAGKNDVISSQ